MRTSSGKQNRGFTLVELAVVIGIISLLAAALLPAIYGAVTKAKEAKQAIEMAAIGKALERYKLEYGEYPPDFAEIAFRTANGESQADRALRATQIIDAHLSRTFRRRSPRDYPRNGGGDRRINEQLLAKLSPRNALVFWLSGFTSDPTLPLSGDSSRTPIYEFDKSRFKEDPMITAATVQSLGNTISNDTIGGTVGFVDGYYPSGVTSQAPYVYYRSTDNGYRWAVDWVARLISNADVDNPAPSAPFQSTAVAGEFAANERFQVISAGLDGDFGVMASDVVNDSATDWNSTLASNRLADRKNQGSSDNLCTAWEGSNLEDFIDQ